MKTYVGVKYSSSLSLPRHKIEMSSHLHASVPLSSWKEPAVPIELEVVGSRVGLGVLEKRRTPCLCRQSYPRSFSSKPTLSPVPIFLSLTNSFTWNWKGVTCFMLRPLYPRGKTRGNHRTGDWVDPLLSISMHLL